MQRRKLTINLQSKPRLVIQRQSLNNKYSLVQSTPHNKGSPNKLAISKENDQSRNSLMRRSSISKSFKIEKLKPRDLNLNPLKTSQCSQNKCQNPPETVNRKAFLQALLQLLLKQPNHHQIQNKITTCLQIIISQGFQKLDNFTKILNRIHQKLSPSQTSSQEMLKKQDLSDHRKSLVKKQLMIQKGLVNYHLRARRQGSKSEGAKFIQQHLKGVKAFILNADSSKKVNNKLQLYQEQLFSFAQEMSLSRFGACKYVPQLNIELLQASIDRQINQLQLIQQKQGISQKLRLNYDFLLQIKQSYNRHSAELIQVISQRTQFSKAFVFKILQWKQKYLERKQELDGLKVNYCQRMSRIAKILAFLSGEASQQARNQLISLQQHIIAISRLFLLGNTLY